MEETKKVRLSAEELQKMQKPTVEQLKCRVYDLLGMKQNIEQELMQVNGLIKKLSDEKVAAEGAQAPVAQPEAPQA